MSDNDRNSPAIRANMLPVRGRGHLPTPELPSSSGSSWGTRLGILRKDAAYVRQHCDYLRSRVIQSCTMAALVESRIGLAMCMSKLAAIGEITAAEYLKGRRQRASDLLVHDIKCQTAETSARANLSDAQCTLAAVSPPVQPPHRGASGLSPAQVDELVGMLPEVSDATRATLNQLLKARLEEGA